MKRPCAPGRLKSESRLLSNETRRFISAQRMTYPVIDFRRPPAPRRASCPPEFFVDLVVTKAIKREKAKAKKSAGKLSKIARISASRW